METTVKIKWDKPVDKDWLCDANVKIALEQHCKNTKFEVEELHELSGSEAIYGFCAWLTTRDEITIMSAKNDCAVIADLIKEFCKENNLTKPQECWDKLLKHPKVK